MHIIAGVLGLLGAVAFLLYRIDAAKENAQRVGEAANDTRLFFRRSKWNRKRKFNPVNEIKDARTAVAVMLVKLATETGALTEATINAIQTQLTTTLQFSDNEAGEVLAQAKWYAQEMGDLDTSLEKIRSRFDEEFDPEQRTDIIKMLTAVGKADGEIDILQQQAINRLKMTWGM